MLVRARVARPRASILGASFVAGAGQALLAIAAAPFLTEHSTPRERTHLFSTFFAIALLAGVIGQRRWAAALPRRAARAARAAAPACSRAYRVALLVGGAARRRRRCCRCCACAGCAEPPHRARAAPGAAARERGRLVPDRAERAA